MDQVVISVDEICHFLLRRGEPISSYNKRRMEDRAVVSCALPLVEKPHALFGSLSFGEVTLCLSGEIDGIVEENGETILCFARAMSARDRRRKVSEEYTTYIKCCAWLYCCAENRDAVRVRAYRVTEDGEQKVDNARYDSVALFEAVSRWLTRILPKANFLRNHERMIRPSAADVVFPYGEVRDGQDELIHRGFHAIKQEKRLFAQAPTGIGKTISTLYPAVRALGKGLCDKIFYFTAKSSTAREAYHAAGKLFEVGAKLRTVMLTAKDQMCCNGCGSGRCNPMDCSFLREYYDRADRAIEELTATRNGYPSDVIRTVAAKYGVCPYELSLDLSERCDIIICDYNYLFDPQVYLRRYFDEPSDFGRYVFLVDEAHNLVDRAREMYSQTLTRSAVVSFLERIPAEVEEVRRAVSAILPTFDQLRALCRETLHADNDGGEIGYYVSRNRVDSFCDAVSELSDRLYLWLRANRRHELYDTVDGFFAGIRKLCCILEYYDDKFMSYVELSSEDVAISICCMDPSDVLDNRLRLGRASILFSATLTPTSYFSDLLGGGREAICVELPSPYEPENLCLAAVDTVSTRFEDREGNCRKIATLIAAAVSPKAGNYIAYFPSYGYLQKVHEAFVKKYPKVKTIVQSRGMTRAQKEEFIASFREDEGKMRIGFCVLGGSFSEGVDLPGSRLIGSIIVGVGLPGFSSERNLMRDYFENRYENGFEYAYTFPGMNNVLQAAGRVIRRDEDRGIVVLIDDRYGTPTYQKLFPSHWKHLKYAGNSASLAEIARKFWEKPKK